MGKSVENWEKIADDRRDALLVAGNYMDGIWKIVRALLDSEDDEPIKAVLYLAYQKINKLIDENV